MLRQSLCVSVVALLVSGLPAPAQQPDGSPTRRLADLAVDVITCSVHPCLGDSEQEVRRLVKGRLVSDDEYSYSDIAVAYPAVEHTLTGVVEWDLDDGLEMASFKVINFDLNAEIFLGQLEERLPGCEMEQEPAETPDDEYTHDRTRAWSCMTGGDDDGILVEIYFVPGMVILEIGG